MAMRQNKAGWRDGDGASASASWRKAGAIRRNWQKRENCRSSPEYAAIAAQFAESLPRSQARDRVTGRRSFHNEAQAGQETIMATTPQTATAKRIGERSRNGSFRS